MIEIDGSVHSGSGTLLRYAVALATLVGRPLRMTRIRAKREKPGLRPQHLQAVLACSALSGGRLEGARVGSQEILFWPGDSLKGGNFRWDIGTAGSTTMMAFTLIPLGLFAQEPCQFSITGGLFQDYAPSAFYMQKMLVPLIQKMGAEVRVEIQRPGYVPRGNGQLTLEVKPLAAPLKPLSMLEQGSVKDISGISLSSHLEKERVSERMAEECIRLLKKSGYQARIDVLHDTKAIQKGAAMILWAQTSTGCLLGADQAGRPGRRSEAIAQFVVETLLDDLQSGATTDRHLADQLILFASLAKGVTEYRIPRRTDHVDANLWLVEKILGARTELRGNHLIVEGVGFHRPRK